MDIPGSLRRTGVILPVTPQPQGLLPFGANIPAPTPVDDLSLNSIVFVPGDTKTTMLEGSDQRVVKYLPTIDGKTLANQVGPYAVLTPHPDSRVIATVVLPPDVASFIQNTPPIEGALALLQALLSRIEFWSQDGCLISARILRAIVRILATYQKALNINTSLTVDLHIYMSIVKTIFTAGLRLLGGRAYQATGSFVPLVQQSSEDMINTVLDPDKLGQDLVYPPVHLVGEMLEVLTRGIIFP